MEQIIIDIINRFGYVGIGFLIAIENIFPPIPSEIILTFGGFMTTITTMNVWGVIIAATIGSVVGAIVLYYLGRILNAERLERLFDSKLGRRLHLKKEDVHRAESWFLRHGNKTIFFCRFIPIVRSLISIPAGVAKMEIGVFLSLTAVGTAIWNIALVFLGKFAGDAWGTIAGYFNIYAIIAAVVFVLIAIVTGIIFIKKRFPKERGAAGKDDPDQ
ncbi:MAG: DedA family protein [Oscillospiraceae bacterium]|nr:DedA family protein [Oscillospiraceae bacterium]